jgi:uncharacterized protein YbjT (DUF2867 family)
MAARILITGATGLVGRTLVQELVKRGVSASVGIHSPHKYDFIKLPDIRYINLNFEDIASMDRALQNIEVLYLITPDVREQVEYVRRIVDRSQIWGVQHIIRLSMFGADAVPGTKFTRWHKQAEQYIEKTGIPFTFLRPNVFMQNFLRHIQPSGGFIALPLNGSKISYVDVRDVADVSAEILQKPWVYEFQKLELTGLEALSIDDVAEYISNQTGYKIGYIPVSEQTARHIFENSGMPDWLVDGMIEWYVMERKGECSSVNMTIENITKKKPVIFSKFVKDNLSAFKALIQHELYLSSG